MPDFPDLSHLLPPLGPEKRRPAPRLVLRHPTEADVPTLDLRLHDWRDNRADSFPGRVWFRHFAGTSWLAEADIDSRPLGLLLGFASADRPREAVIHLVMVDPAFRRKGIGRLLVTHFEEQLRETGAARATATCRPEDRIAVAFFGALGYTPAAGPGTRRLYGFPAYEDWEGAGGDRVLLERTLG